MPVKFFHGMPESIAETCCDHRKAIRGDGALNDSDFIYLDHDTMTGGERALPQSAAEQLTALPNGD